MSVNLPQGTVGTLPDVPTTLDPETRKYLVDLRRNIIQQMGNLVDNDTTLQNAINTGATGTYVTSGKSFVFVNGVLTGTV